MSAQFALVYPANDAVSTAAGNDSTSITTTPASAEVITINNVNELFDQFWIAYPRHEAKKDARKAWLQADPRRYVDIIVAALLWRRYWASVGRDVEKIPLPATWIRGERFDDELPPGFRELPARKVNGNGDGAKAPEPFVRGEIPEVARLAIAKLKERSRL